jgi:hypothetical protein
LATCRCTDVGLLFMATTRFPAAVTGPRLADVRGFLFLGLAAALDGARRIL